MSIEVIITLLMFSFLVLSIMFGISLSFALGAVGSVAAISMGVGFIPIVSGVFKYMWMLVLVALPLFIFMGVALGKSKIAEDMYRAFYLISGSLRGGLALGSSFFAAALSAMTGNCSASTITVGVVAIPPMKKYGYKDSIIFGTIGAAGTLGILIPPSITLIIIGMMTGQSIRSLFLGGLIAGLSLLLLFTIYLIILCHLNPSLAPATTQNSTIKEKIIALRSILFPLVIIVAVLGSIFAGMATPTEAASIGAVAVLFCVIIRGEFNITFLREVTHQTAIVSGMVLWIMFGAAGFIAIYSGSGAISFVQNFILGLDLSPWVILVITQILVIVFGMFLDPMGIILLALPIFFPIVITLGFDPIWYCIIFNIGLCIGYITPPFGYNLFYLKQLWPETPIWTIYKSVFPFIIIMLIDMGIIMLFPQIITGFAGKI